MVQSGKITPDEFAQRLIQAIQEASGREFTFDDSEFRLFEPDGDGFLNLGALYQEHCDKSEDERPAHLQGLVSVVCQEGMEVPADFASAKAGLRPKIWARGTLDLAALQHEIQGQEFANLPLKPLGSHMYYSLVYDTEHAMQSISCEQLDEWGVSFEQAFDVAVVNLEESTSAIAQIGDHFFAPATGDNYDSARVMQIDRIEGLDTPGECVAMVAERDGLYITGSRDEMGLKLMVSLTDQASENARPICPVPLVLTEDGWQDWIPPANHVLRSEFDRLEVFFLAGLYNQQKPLLDELLDADVDDYAFVASFSAIQLNESGAIRSYCVWGEDVISLLPRTQIIVFMGEDGTLASGEWSHVQSVVGELMYEEEEHYPPRYRVIEFPAAEQLEQIGFTEGFGPD